MYSSLPQIVFKKSLDHFEFLIKKEPVFGTAEGALGDLEDHRLDPGEARLGGHLDHVLEFVVVALAGALHEPGVDLGTESNVAHTSQLKGKSEK